MQHLKTMQINNSHTPKGQHQFGVVIYLSNIELGEQIAMQLMQFGYDTRQALNHNEFNQILDQQKPQLIIMSMDLADGRGPELLKAAFDESITLPVIYICNDTSIENQLDAVNNGGIAFYSEQFEFTSLLDKLDHISHRVKDPDFRVLIIDDDPMVAEHQSIILQAAGMQTQVSTNPLAVMKLLTEFEPDLLLIDFHMPECSGIDLAKVIRQHDEYSSLPIVFLSSEQDQSRQFSAINLGADDFLSKHIDPSHLMTSLAARIKRARKIRSLMDRDSLSGLLNHSSIKHQLLNEVKRTNRNNTKFCYVMLDIDNFKLINDTYGHAAGDRVIRQLSHLLKQRLRATDIVGRYGGEEFAVIMPDTNINDASLVINEIRKTFSNLQQQENDAIYHCTFSAGIAEYPSYPDAAELHNAADKMLYKSKQSGKNRIFEAPANSQIVKQRHPIAD